MNRINDIPIYNIGDKVRIIELNVCYPPPCLNYLDEVMTITEIIHEPTEEHCGVYRMKEDGGLWLWGSNVFEYIKD